MGWYRSSQASREGATLPHSRTAQHDIESGARHDCNDVSLGDSDQDALLRRIEELGRERPAIFQTTLHEAMFVFCISMSQFLTEYFVSDFTLILPTLIEELDIPQAAAIWPATAFSLVIASFLLVLGRTADMFGGRLVFLLGLIWLLAWSIIAGFSVNALMLDFCRALQGLGAAATLPSGILLMGSIYRPGPRKNLVFSIYGTSAVLGFFGGIVLAGVVGQFLRWGFYFWIGAILSGVTLLNAIWSLPRANVADHDSEKVSMDYTGGLLIVAGLILTVFAITQSAHAPAGWRTPYIPVCFCLGIVLLFCAAVFEARFASEPLLPKDVLLVPSLTPLLFAVLILYGCWGIFSVYGTLYFQNILNTQPLQIALWYVPLGVAGLLFSIMEGMILHLVPGRVLLIIPGIGSVGPQLLLALLQVEGWSYWAWIFPATILSTIGIDLSTILLTVFITTKLPLAQQGLAGGILNSVLQLGVALTLGLTDILQSATVDKDGLRQSYKNTFWFGVGAAAISLLVMALYGDVPRATSELSLEEREELIRAAEREGYVQCQAGNVSS
ncbi:Drug resistance protein [Cercospora beticola]|uniref:Drug resistance protein n=1 Tax=Cercospora beticola TaxID=122368 RepID=A0A2G5HIG5_CERBT|nr:Drug resistance protein [Cercospora beticola]PIA92319.1 Drug resistance protein [Cercospora beticola]WPB05602.1 hypothetical protein RHO25_010255 [Cercospora beticola]